MIIAGVDEVGIGALAGPVCAVAVILPIQGLGFEVTDSKKLSAKKRVSLCELIAQVAEVSIGWASVTEIDRLNVLKASHLAMARAVDGLSTKPDEVWVDGNRAPDLDYPVKTVIGGDATVDSISAASIVAKVNRDLLLINAAEQYPLWGFERHKGYPTPFHKEMIAHHGICEMHRRSYGPVAQQLSSQPAID